MKSKLFKYLLAGMILLPGFASIAQINPCLTNMKDAATKTEQGWYDEAIMLVESTLKDCDLSKKDKIEAYKLLITNYLAIDNLEAAAEAAAAIMKIDPNYESDRLRDPAEMVVLFEKYKRAVIFRGVIFGGVNKTLVQSTNNYSIVGPNDADSLDNYQDVTAFQIGVAGEYRIYRELWLQTSIQFRKSSYSIDVPNIEGRTVSYREDLNYFDIPLSAKYYITKSKLQPYVEAGLNFSFLTASLGELSRDGISDIVNRMVQRNALYLGYFGGLGLAYNHKNYGIQIGLNYAYNPQQVNKDGTRYENLDMVFKYYYLDNDFTMDNIQLNVGFKYAIGYKKALSSTI
jgi:hypothetical protein